MYNNEFSQEFEQAFGQELETGGPSLETFEFNPEFLGETSGETQGESFEMNGEFSGEFSGELNETMEMELAHELLEVSNEEELNMFLGKLIKGAARGISNFAKSGVGRAIGGVLKTVAKKALPIAGGALGTFFGGPLGSAVGSKLGSLAGNLFELELEGLSPEDQEFETARAYVRFANSAASRAATIQSQRRGAPAPTVVRQALATAARQHAPGLLRPRNPDGTFRSVNSRPGQRPAPRPVGRPAQGGARRPAYTAPRRPAYGAAPGRPAPAYGAPFYGAPAYGGAPAAPAHAANGYAPSDNGYYDQPDFDGADEQDQGSYAPARATRGTWMRRGRTLVIQL
ncbi:hypothetical protein [Hymenobacter terrenus]|uniref:hypothetical protein n=1 Tax=Hymenobacter terrenus TaxID=1629124 RepID=UPI0006975C7C|nr:hypothetical protein [Hymenobacter terrenus]